MRATPLEETPESLLAAVARRDRAALRRLYESESSRLFAIALRILRDRAAAADAVHDAFLQVWERADRYNATAGAARAWLAAIARYRALDLARARGRELPVETPIGEEVASDEPSIADLIVERSEAARLHDCLRELDEKNRQLIVLAFVDGYSHSQIAARAELPLGTVKSWIRRGLAALRACLER